MSPDQDLALAHAQRVYDLWYGVWLWFLLPIISILWLAGALVAVFPLFAEFRQGIGLIGVTGREQGYYVLGSLYLVAALIIGLVAFWIARLTIHPARQRLQQALEAAGLPGEVPERTLPEWNIRLTAEQALPAFLGFVYGSIISGVIVVDDPFNLSNNWTTTVMLVVGVLTASAAYWWSTRPRRQRE